MMKITQVYRIEKYECNKKRTEPSHICEEKAIETRVWVSDVIDKYDSAVIQLKIAASHFDDNMLNCTRTANLDNGWIKYEKEHSDRTDPHVAVGYKLIYKIKKLILIDPDGSEDQ